METSDVHNVLEGLRPLLVPIGDLNLDPENVRLHDERNMQAVRNSLETFGQHHPVVVQKENMVVRIGNARLQAARDLGWTHIAALVVDEGRVKAMARAIADNRTGELSVWDFQGLSGQLDQLAGEGWGTDLVGFDTFSVDVEFEKQDWAMPDNRPKSDAVETPEVVEDVVPEPPEEPVARPGDLWVLGRHRIVCGDSTDLNVIEQVVGGSSVRLCLTDPPYSVNYGRTVSERGGNQNAHAGYIDPTHATDLLRFLNHIPSDVLVMTYPIDRHFFALADALRDASFEMRREVIWLKNQFSFWPSANYQQIHEPIIVAAKKGRPLNANVPADQSTVIEIPRPHQRALHHPTERPQKLWSMLMRYHSDEGDVVVDPFSGSGTTLLVAEQINRTACVVELSPKYVDVAVKRWENLTGEKAVRHEA